MTLTCIIHDAKYDAKCAQCHFWKKKYVNRIQRKGYYMDQILYMIK